VLISSGVLLDAALGWLAGTLQRPALVIGQDAAVSGVAADAVTARFDAFGFIDVRPTSEPVQALLIVYGGGLVRPQAYEWLGTALAPYGVRTVIPVFPLDVAFLATNRADALLTELARRGERPGKVFLAGHSLGGAMAVRFATGSASELSGLILMGAYGSERDDLSAVTLPVLVLAAENDALASLAEIREGLVRLPRDANLVVLPGAVHAFFGRYGPQRGDGQPEVPREETEQRIVDALRRFMLASAP